VPPLNPKRRVIRNRVLRRAVTRGVDTFYWGVSRNKKQEPEEQKQKKAWGEDDALAIISFALMMFLVSMILKSC